MHYLQLITSKSCNQNCYYCNVFEPEREVEIDVDFLEYALDCFPVEMGVELTGGEIGLIKNLDQFFTTVYDHPKVGHITALSNGLIRVLDVDWLDKVEYWEHLIFDIDEKHIEKFYDLDLQQKHKYVIVMTERTTKSLLNNWKHFDDMGLFKKNFFYKIMNAKTHSIEDYSGELMHFYHKLNDLYCKKMVEDFVMENGFDQKHLCSKNSPNPFVDFDTRELGHCAAFIPLSMRVPFNKVNLIMNMRCSKFNPEENYYCFSKCGAYDIGYDKGDMIKECKKGNYENRSYKCIK